ncbi:Magnesium transporting ATPase, P-type 1 [Salmonella enterica subsp. enterica]|uniref:Magnesium transporting ATPase, P-type 1 n=1 Tax=Salmonella enterica I TaxID=59201 RepID=A0A379WJV0_SALET|nr:Magnesium transporting ATPase, P-type 1 [Salmonella enterica subsp. enterica]
MLIATRKLDGSGNNPTLSVEDETELTIEGMLTFLDPPKESAGKAIAALRDNGVAVKVLTGDNPVVTARICLEVGIDTHDILTGTQVEAMSGWPNWRSEVEKRAVFARLTPLQKTRILQALQKKWSYRWFSWGWDQRRARAS